MTQIENTIFLIEEMFLTEIFKVIGVQFWYSFDAYQDIKD